MYSLVLMACMTSGPDTADFNGLFRRNNGCEGCYGGAVYASGCAGCSGCCGGGCCGGRGFLGLGLTDRVRSWFGRSGCNGCCGGCSGCSGCSGCCGGCMGACYGCSGASFSCFGSVPAVSYTPSFGGCVGGPVPAAGPPVMAPGGVPFAPPQVAPPETISATPPPSGLRAASAQVPAGPEPRAALTTSNPGLGRAVVVVRLPADARLFAEGKLLSLTSAERRFVSPELPTGQDFTYQFRAEYDRDGETISVARKVTVRAGGTAAVEFADLTAARTPPPAPPRVPAATTAVTQGVAVPTMTVPPVRPLPAVEPAAKPAPVVLPPLPQADRATITVKLPAGATLVVDGQKNGSSAAVRQFTTPPLPGGQEFAYLMKAEVVRNGRPESLTQKVPFKAGEKVTVDFTGVGGGPLANNR